MLPGAVYAYNGSNAREPTRIGSSTEKSLTQETWHTFVELAPWLLLGAAVAGLLEALLPPGLLRRHLTGRWGVARAVAFGVPLPLCSCGVIPTGLGLKRQGASDGATVGFLISTPQTGVDSVLVTAAMLSWPFALFKLVT
ncbi:MAG: permease, partial [Planctomycetota bacterium]